MAGGGFPCWNYWCPVLVKCCRPLPWTCATGTGTLNISLPAEVTSAAPSLRLKRCRGRGGRLGDIVRSPWRHGIHAQVAAGGTRSPVRPHRFSLVCLSPCRYTGACVEPTSREVKCFSISDRGIVTSQKFFFFAGVYL